MPGGATTRAPIPFRPSAPGHVAFAHALRAGRHRVTRSSAVLSCGYVLLCREYLPHRRVSSVPGAFRIAAGPGHRLALATRVTPGLGHHFAHVTVQRRAQLSKPSPVLLVRTRLRQKSGDLTVGVHALWDWGGAPGSASSRAREALGMHAAREMETNAC